MLASSISTIMDNKQEFFQKLLMILIILNSINLSLAQTTTTTKQIFAYYYIGCYNARTDLLQESIYAKMPATCVEICEHQNYSYAVLSYETCFCANHTLEEERQDTILCNNRCLADKTQYCGGAGVHSYYSTRLAKEPKPKQLKVEKATESSLSIMWEAPHPINKVYIPTSDAETMSAAMPPQITHFLIKSQLVLTFSALPIFPQPEFIVQASESKFEITDLQPATTYSISVVAMCDRVNCGNATVLGTTLVGQPDPIPPQPRILRQTDHTITIQIPILKNNNGPITKLYVLVERVDDALSQPFDTSLLGDWRKAQDDGLPYYITAELEYENRTLQFIVGDGQRYGRYENVPLELTSGHVHISLGVESSLNNHTKVLFTRGSHAQHTMSLDNFTYVNFESGKESIIALIVVCIIFATCLVLSIFTYFFLRYKTCKMRSNMSRNAHEMTLQEPIIERENNGYVMDDELPAVENFKQQLDAIVDNLAAEQRLPRSMLRMNVNDVIAEGRYGEVITGKILINQTPEGNKDCQLHMLALDDLSSTDKAYLLQEFRKLTRLQRHDHLLDFYGVSATSDWFYMVFEHQQVTLKERLLESRRLPHSTTVQRISAFSEELVLQWIYEVASALSYLSSCKVVHKQLCSHNIYVTADSQLKVAVFGPVPFGNQQKKIDLSRWLAPESMRYQHYSSKSDIWAFACVAWECCALGGTPYANITSSHLLPDAIKNGARPIQPAYVFHDLYQMLLNCWQLEPSDRIDFEEILLTIRQLMTSPRHALCFDRAPTAPGNNVLDTLPYYLPMLEVFN